MKVGKTTQMIVILIDNEYISLNSLSNNESMNCLYTSILYLYIIFCFHSDDAHSDYTRDYESTEVFDDIIESLQREFTTEIGGF